MNVEQRLARLERANRRQKRIGTLVVVVAAVVLLVAAVVLLSGQAKGKNLQDLEVRSLTLKDKAGKRRALLAVVADRSPTLALFDKDGKLRAQFRVGADGSPGLFLHDKTTMPRAALILDGLFLHDKDSKTRAALTAGEDGSTGLVLFDKDGKKRATLGVTTTVNKRTGAETKTAESTLTLFDAKGGVIWRAPR